MRTYTALPRNIPRFAAIMAQQALRRAKESPPAPPRENKIPTKPY